MSTYALYETDTGRLVSVGSTAASPVPSGLTLLDLGTDDRLLTGYGYWDPATRTVLNVVPSPVDLVATVAALTDVTALTGRLTRLAAYKTDTDLTTVLAQTNNQALPTATLNRALKTMIRRDERQTAAIALLVRLLNNALLADVTDTTDA